MRQLIAALLAVVLFVRALVLWHRYEGVPFSVRWVRGKEGGLHKVRCDGGGLA